MVQKNLNQQFFPTIGLITTNKLRLSFVAAIQYLVFLNFSALTVVRIAVLWLIPAKANSVLGAEGVMVRILLSLLLLNSMSI